MNRNSCAKRLLSLLLCLTLILGLLPNVALAADADGVRYQENADVAVTYDDVDRTHATVRYHKPGAQVDSYNIIFLVDTSVQGKDSFESFEKMMVESGSDTIFDSTSNNLVSLINYTTTAETNRVNNDGIYALMSQVIHGAGTANEITALDAALAEVKSLKNSERSSYPTIVFWVLGKELVEVGNAAFESIACFQQGLYPCILLDRSNILSFWCILYPLNLFKDAFNYQRTYTTNNHSTKIVNKNAFNYSI